MQRQTTLDGKIYKEEFTKFEIRTLIKRADEIAKTNPKYFAELCAYQGVAYHSKPSIINTFRCCSEFQEILGFFTENMVNALAAYPIEG